MSPRDAKDLILSRRARFVAASLASLGVSACDPPPARDASVWGPDAGAPDATSGGTSEPRPDPTTVTGQDEPKPPYYPKPPYPMPCLSIAM
ncbi:MAG: hypothetical protein ABI175_07650, partial [Polyangiales bacterium]